MARIFDDDNKLVDVTTIEQALFHLKVMRGGIMNSLSLRDDEEATIDRVQAQALAVAIDYIKQHNQTEPGKWVSNEEYCERHHYKPSGSISWYCPNCWSVSEYRFNFCHRCGKRLNGDDEVAD